VIALRDPEAIMAVFPADHLIQPVEEFRRTIGIAYALAERHSDILISFGITPATHGLWLPGDRRGVCRIG
jgi:mannose-1-phosphate guanylyltransferase